MSKGVIYSLFDGSGLAVIDWAKAGYSCFCFNADDADHGAYSSVRVQHENITYINTWIDLDWAENLNLQGLPAPDMLLAFPPCTDMSVSGARYFSKKKEKDPFFQIKAVRTAKIAAYLAEFFFDCPYMIENPVSVLSSKWRKPDYIFHPYEMGGYLPEDDVHPYYPEYIKSRDAYPKKTCLWVGNGFIMPERKSVPVEDGFSDQYHKLGGKSQKTKTIRSLTPRSFAKAVFEANHKLIENK